MPVGLLGADTVDCRHKNNQPLGADTVDCRHTNNQPLGTDARTRVTD